MRFKPPILICLLALFSMIAMPAFGQTESRNGATINQPVRDFARSRWQRTDVEILRADEELTATRLPKSKSDGPNPNFQADSDLVRFLAMLILITVIGIGVYLMMKNRVGGGLFDKRSQDKQFDVDGVEVGGMDVTASNAFSLDALKRNQDTRQALRLLLVNVLARAAKANDVPVRRSLTARDIVARLPESWNERKRVASLVAIAEPILYGGRVLEPSRLDGLIEHARPIISEGGRKR